MYRPIDGLTDGIRFAEVSERVGDVFPKSLKKRAKTITDFREAASDKPKM
jgi:hypothetical protein